jgi:hypothetical protein
MDDILLKDDTYYLHQTPQSLCERLMDYIDFTEGDRVHEPFKGESGFFNCFPETTINTWTEIKENKCYKSFTDKVDWVITNPPFRIDTGGKGVNSFFFLLKHFMTISEKGIAFLGNDNCWSAFTPKRIKEFNDDGWFIHKVVVCAIKKWRGRYYFIIFKKEPCSFFEPLVGNY